MQYPQALEFQLELLQVCMSKNETFDCLYTNAVQLISYLNQLKGKFC